MTCRHCGKPIRRHYANYTHGWTHEGGDVWCRKTMADIDEQNSEGNET